MKVFHAQSQLSQYLQPLKQALQTIGFVPTMGALHKGHLSLLQQALSENDVTVVSIFVNPTQFNNAEDLAKYPRTLDRDVALLETLSDKIIVYAPSVDDIYEGNTVAKSFDYDGLDNEMEGSNRPGHFNGVGTIVKKLFEIVQPNNAYFGEKDFQQLQIIRKMVAKNMMDINVIGCPIYREANGLAMSSRNERLSAQAKEKAAVIYKTLQTAKKLFVEKDIVQAEQFVKETFANEADFDLEYFVIADEVSLKTATQKTAHTKYRAFIVVHVEGIRLIDNIALN
ncbi:pantoate--beta-alanine ligase [Flavobacterium sp. CBA20B-1]|uniref:pantoate--beta-alanine ligase n=1 Tax=unclassified Flavobacterium TaxID=196869 RepID=UPI002225A99D|nr:MULTISPECIES: pantoate--beta-alanine ligase [unclassified Flavobacterium]WCM41025.1 pantoate--beta-alanine ligase [Flavobacterium sp. CBA20B-1]